MRKEEYLDKVAEQMRCEKARQLVKDEMKDHIEDQAEAFMNMGMKEYEAEEKAVEEMGDPVEAGVMMDRTHRPQRAWGMLLLIAAVSILGIAVQFVIDVGGSTDTASIQSILGVSFYRQVIYVGIGFAAMLAVYLVDYSILSKRPKTAAGLFLAFMFINIFFTGVQMNGAMMYFRIGGFMISLPMLMYLYVPLYGAVLYGERKKGWPALLACIMWMIVPVFFTVRIPSLNVALNLFAVMLVMLTIAVAKGWFQVKKGPVITVMWGTVLAVPAVFVFMVLNNGSKILAPYQMMRIRAWNTPGLYADGAGYQTVKFKEMMDTSRLLGANKEGMHVFADLWQSQNSEYILTHITTYYGLLVSALLVGLLVWMILKVFQISADQKNQLGMMVGFGCGLVFGFQTLSYVLQNFGLVPPTSGFLPLFSHGMTGTMVTYVLLGILLSIYRYQNILPAEPKSGKELEIS